MTHLVYFNTIIHRRVVFKVTNSLIQTNMHCFGSNQSKVIRVCCSLHITAVESYRQNVKRSNIFHRFIEVKWLGPAYDTNYIYTNTYMNIENYNITSTIFNALIHTMLIKSLE